MASQNLVQSELKGDTSWITLDSPHTRNALSGALVSELNAHLTAALDDAAVGTLVITGNGPAFCAGADLKTGGDLTKRTGGEHSPLVELLKLIWDGPKPVIAAVNGHAFGGGVGLVAACDIAIAVDRATFSFSEVRLGLIPGVISVVVLPKIGVHQAMRLFLTGERFDAHAALGYGLLHRVVPPDALESAVHEELDAIAKGGPIAIGEAKQLIRTVSTLSMDEAFAFTEQKSAELFASEEAAEGMAAFTEKRPPKWVK